MEDYWALLALLKKLKSANPFISYWRLQPSVLVAVIHLINWCFYVSSLGQWQHLALENGYTVHIVTHCNPIKYIYLVKYKIWCAYCRGKVCQHCLTVKSCVTLLLTRNRESESLCTTESHTPSPNSRMRIMTKDDWSYLWQPAYTPVFFLTVFRLQCHSVAPCGAMHSWCNAQSTQ